jgi:hypothetical protein
MFIRSFTGFEESVRITHSFVLSFAGFSRFLSSEKVFICLYQLYYRNLKKKGGGGGERKAHKILYCFN